MEQWDLFNEDRTPTGKIINKGEKIEGRLCRQVVHVIIFNDNNEMLIQQRQAGRKLWPEMWDVSVGGSSIAGETQIQAAERETLEELGIKVDLSQERPYFTINFNNGFDDFFIIRQNIDLSSITMQLEEVKDYKWASCDEIMVMVENEQFIPYYKSVIPFLFDQVKGRGLHRQ